MCLLVEEGGTFTKFHSVMGKSCLSMKGKLFNSGLNSVIVATIMQGAVATTTATTTSESSVFGPGFVINPAIVDIVAVNLKVSKRQKKHQVKSEATWHFDHI